MEWLAQRSIEVGTMEMKEVGTIVVKGLTLLRWRGLVGTTVVVHFGDKALITAPNQGYITIISTNDVGQWLPDGCINLYDRAEWVLTRPPPSLPFPQPHFGHAHPTLVSFCLILIFCTFLYESILVFLFLSFHPTHQPTM